LGNAFKKRIDSVTFTSHGCKDEQKNLCMGCCYCQS
jgi:hypothetical protein